MKNADYRKHNDGSHSSSTYHKKDGTNVRAILKREAMSEADELHAEVEAPVETHIIDALAQLVQRYGPEVGLTKCSYDGDHNSASMIFTYKGESWLISSSDVEPCS